VQDSQYNLRVVYGDILRGYSAMLYNESTLYIRHHTNDSLAAINIHYDDFINQAKINKLPTEKESLALLLKQDRWTEYYENELENSRLMIKGLEENRRTVFLESQLEDVKKDIRREQANYSSLAYKKQQLIGLTQEIYANRQIKNLFICSSLFTDDKFIKPVFDLDDWNNLSNKEFNDLEIAYNIKMDNFSSNSIKKLSLASFVQSMWGLSNDSVYDFFGVPICKLSTFQVDLMQWTKIFASILSKHQNIPEELYDDPNALIDFVNTGRNIKEIQDKAGGGNATIVGAKQKDYQKINRVTNPGEFINKIKDSGKTTAGLMDLIK